MVGAVRTPFSVLAQLRFPFASRADALPGGLPLLILGSRHHVSSSRFVFVAAGCAAHGFVVIQPDQFVRVRLAAIRARAADGFRITGFIVVGHALDVTLRPAEVNSLKVTVWRGRTACGYCTRRRMKAWAAIGESLVEVLRDKTPL